MSQWAEYLYTTFADAYRRPGMAGLLDAFLDFKEEAAEPTSGRHGGATVAAAPAAPPPPRHLPRGHGRPPHAQRAALRGHGGQTGRPRQPDDAHRGRAGSTAEYPLPAAGEVDEPPARVVNPSNIDAATSGGNSKRFVLLPVGNGDITPTRGATRSSTAPSNCNPGRAQLFAALDAAALVWSRAMLQPGRHQPAVDGRVRQPGRDALLVPHLRRVLPHGAPGLQAPGQPPLGGGREAHPGHRLPSKFIGALCDDTFAKLFPLSPSTTRCARSWAGARAQRHVGRAAVVHLRRHQRRGRDAAQRRAPRAALDAVGLYDPPTACRPTRGSRTTTWASRRCTTGLPLGLQRLVRVGELQPWLKYACRYQPPRTGESCLYPSRSTAARPSRATSCRTASSGDAHADAKRHERLVFGRFGFTAPLRIGKQLGLRRGPAAGPLLGNYRPTPTATSSSARCPPRRPSTRPTPATTRAPHRRALASCNHGTEEASAPRVVRNLYRLYVDTYKCMGLDPEDEGVPVVMGFAPAPVTTKEDRPIVLYAGTLACVNAKIEEFCASHANRNESVCKMYKQVYLNDAALLYTRPPPSGGASCTTQHLRARLKRGPTPASSST